MRTASPGRANNRKIISSIDGEVDHEDVSLSRLQMDLIKLIESKYDKTVIIPIVNSCSLLDVIVLKEGEEEEVWSFLNSVLPPFGWKGEWTRRPINNIGEISKDRSVLTVILGASCIRWWNTNLHKFTNFVCNITWHRLLFCASLILLITSLLLLYYHWRNYYEPWTPLMAMAQHQKTRLTNYWSRFAI